MNHNPTMKSVIRSRRANSSVAIRSRSSHLTESPDCLTVTPDYPKESQDCLRHFQLRFGLIVRPRSRCLRPVPKLRTRRNPRAPRQSPERQNEPSQTMLTHVSDVT